MGVGGNVKNKIVQIMTIVVSGTKEKTQVMMKVQNREADWLGGSRKAPVRSNFTVRLEGGREVSPGEGGGSSVPGSRNSTYEGPEAGRSLEFSKK